MANSPEWSTPERKAQLVKLFLDSGGFCVFGHPNCTIPSHHYSLYIECLIDDWKAQDIDAWKAERIALHSLGERRTPIAGRFNNISRDIFYDSQPLYYVEALGMDGLKLKPFAKIKLSSSYMRLYIDLDDSLRGTSKNKRRKALRYGKQLPMSITNKIADLASKAVKDYLNH
jgi:hypothetical protein